MFIIKFLLLIIEGSVCNLVITKKYGKSKRITQFVISKRNEEPILETGSRPEYLSNFSNNHLNIGRNELCGTFNKFPDFFFVQALKLS